MAVHRALCECERSRIWRCPVRYLHAAWRKRNNLLCSPAWINQHRLLLPVVETERTGNWQGCCSLRNAAGTNGGCWRRTNALRAKGIHATTGVGEQAIQRAWHVAQLRDVVGKRQRDRVIAQISWREI